MPLVTILTPTYNRAEYLNSLYESILQQDADEWLWLIVDDGSTDNTRECVQKWIKEHPERIQYIYKQNGGKHTALNLGISLVMTPMVFIVDSDDTLMPDAVSCIRNYYDRYTPDRDRYRLCGFSFLRVSADGIVNAGEYPQDNVIGSYVANRVNVGDIGDKAEVFYTDALQRYPFPELEGERFLPEDAVWIRMSEDYNLVHSNRKIYVCDYLDGGLTRSGRSMKIHSPLGMMYRSVVYLNGTFPKNRKIVIKMQMLYQIYRRFAQRQYHICTDDAFAAYGVPACPFSILSLLLHPVTWLIYCKWALQYRDNH